MNSNLFGACLPCSHPQTYISLFTLGLNLPFVFNFLPFLRHKVGFCGDGGNDSGALKCAHAGIALSEAEASVVSHFSSNDRSIYSCVRVLRESRCSLDVSFSSYKYLIMYGEILAFVGLIQVHKIE